MIKALIIKGCGTKNSLLIIQLIYFSLKRSQTFKLKINLDSEKFEERS